MPISVYRRGLQLGIVALVVLLLLPMVASAAVVTVASSPVPGLYLNGRVKAVALGDGVAYVGGDFTQATGSNGTFSRARVAAFDLTTGAVTGFRADASGSVRALALSGSSLYIGGDFTSVNGVGRSRLAQVSAADGSVNTGFAVSASSSVRALAVGGGRLYVGGAFGSIGGVAQGRIAAVDLASRSVVGTFRPVVNATVHAVTATPSGDRVYVGGDFTQVSGQTRNYLAAFSPAGADRGTPFDLGEYYNVLGLSLHDDGSRLYAALGGSGNQVAAFSTSSGTKHWRQRAMGDVQAVDYYKGNVYFGFHEGFQDATTEVEDLTVRLLVADADTGMLENYRPTVNSFMGVWAVQAGARGLLAGGEFTRVSGVPAGRVAIFASSLNDGTSDELISKQLTPGDSKYVPIDPLRVKDTRSTRAVGANQVLRVKVAGAGTGVPADAGAVSTNVTVTSTKGSGWLKVWPCGAAEPNASSLNFVAGQTVPNAVLSKVGSNGELCTKASAGTHIIVDLNGYFPEDSGFTAMTPQRVKDTRSTRAVGANQVLRVKVAGAGTGVPADAGAVSTNVTVTSTKGSGWLKVWPCGAAEPNASSLNFVAGQTVPNAVLSKVGSNGELCTKASAGTHIIVDLNGYFPEDSGFTAMTPQRVKDTRSTRAVGANQVLRVKVAGAGTGVPADAGAVSTNVTVTSTKGSGWLKVWPCGAAEPNASSLNFVAGQTVPNAVLSKVGSNGELCTKASAGTHIIVDLNGYFE